MISPTTALASLDGLVCYVIVLQIAVIVRACGKYTTSEQTGGKKPTNPTDANPGPNHN